VGEAVPGVADATVDLDGGLADGAGRSGAVGLGDPSGGEGLIGFEGVDSPLRVQGYADRTLHQAVGLGEQVLHGLERSDGDAELLAFRRVGDGDVERAAHDADEVGTGERQAQRGPGREVVLGQGASAADNDRRV